MVSLQVTYERERKDYDYLIDNIKESQWIDSDTIIINCKPEKSSIIAQIANHKLSHLNRNELFEQMNLEIPDEDMSQIWDPQSREYILFDRYLVNWVLSLPKAKFLFISADISNIKPYIHLKLLIKSRLEPDQYRFATCYMQKNSDFKPDFYHIVHNDRVIFQWQNDNKHS